MNIKKSLIIFALFIWLPSAYSVPAHTNAKAPIYICTAANHSYFLELLNLIGSIHKTNYRHLKEIAVYDLGLTKKEIAFLNTVNRVVVYTPALTHPDQLKPFTIPTCTRKYLGWYTWKYVVIHQALQSFPYVLWLDAGTTVGKPLDAICSYIMLNGYFLCTIGDEKDDNGNILHPVGWGANKHLISKFNLDAPEHQWILKQESVMGGIIGVSQQGRSAFLDDMYALCRDFRCFEDDGSTPQGYGCAAHDQAVLSILAYTKNLKVFKQDYTQCEPMILFPENLNACVRITWHKQYFQQQTDIYSSRHDMRGYRRYIRYKTKGK